MVDAEASPSSIVIPTRRVSRGWVLLGSILILLAIGVGTAFFQWRADLQVAREALARGDLQTARNAAEHYLRYAPTSAPAHMLAGDAYFQDNSLPPLEAADQAISHYSRIPDDSDLGSTARLLAGRATFLVRQEPSRAERLFRRSVELNPDQFDGYYMQWQLHNVTERYFDCEPLFREVYRLCPVESRALRLREWYSSQFTPLSACGQLDLMMQFRQDPEVPSEEIAFERLTAFCKYEPDEPNTIAALAQWHLRSESRESALEVLDAIPHRDQAIHSQFYLATLVETLIEVGQMERAGVEFSKWSGPVEGYQYLRIAGIHSQEVAGEMDEAVKYLTRAVNSWPGPTDWLLMNRLSRCLALQGKRDESQRVSLEAKRVEGLTDLAIHKKVRQALGQLDQPDGLEEVVRFYESLHRDWEAAAWREVISDLRKSPVERRAIPPRN